MKTLTWLKKEIYEIRYITFCLYVGATWQVALDSVFEKLKVR